MSSLAGLVNYSDEDDSSGEELQEITPLPAVKIEPKPEKKIQPAPLNEFNKRLLAALAPNPIQDIDNWGIPEEPNTSCDPERAERIAHFLSLRASGHRLNDHLQRNKAFRNPRIYTKLVEFTEVDEIGSNFDKQVFDPHGFPKEMYIDGILETQRQLAEEKATQQQNRTTVNFVQPSQQAAMAQAMATAAKVASRIVKPPSMDHVEKRKSKWEDDQPHKRKY